MPALAIFRGVSRRLRLSAHRVGYLESDVEAWINARMAAPIRELPPPARNGEERLDANG